MAAGQVEEAVLYLTAAGDSRAAGRLLLSTKDAFLEQGAAATFLRLGDGLGEATSREDPTLAVALAGTAGQSGHLDRVAALLDIAEPHLGGRPLTGRAVVLAIGPVGSPDAPRDRDVRPAAVVDLVPVVAASPHVGLVLAGLAVHT